jgi:hypothetical protein
MREQLTVQTSSSTTYTERGASSASLTDVTVGENVAVFGTVSGSTVTATQIAIGGNGIGGGGYLGGGRHHEGDDYGRLAGGRTQTARVSGHGHREY